MSKRYLLFVILAAASLISATCGKKKEEDAGGEKAFNLTSNMKEKASIFSITCMMYSL